MVAKMHRMHLPKVGEGVIHIPGGVPFEADDTPLYPPGSYMRLGNKEFIYAIAGGSLIPDVGAMNSFSQKVSMRNTSAKILIGATVITITVAAGLEIAEDELAGGEIVVFPGDNNSFTRGIVSNNAIATGVGGTLAVVVDSPIPVEIPAGKGCECIRSPYSAVKENQGEWAMVMGMPTVVATVGQGLWLQVSGPSWAAPAAEVGALVKNQEAVFVGNGSLALRSTAGNEDCQFAGVIIATAEGGGQGAPFIMLQIAH